MRGTLPEEPARDGEVAARAPQAGPIEFHPLEPAHFPLLHRWLNAPHVLRWWNEPVSLEETAAKYGPLITGVEPTRGHILVQDGRPVGFIQSYFVADHPEYAAAVQVEPGAVGVDLFIGEADAVYQGLGTRALRQFLREVVFADPRASCSVLGPDPENRAAIRCYEKVGYRFIKQVQLPGAPAPEYLMRVDRAGTAGG